MSERPAISPSQAGAIGPGRLVLVVGPSGAGKDTLLEAARAAFRDDARIRFARRVITRVADPDGEDHEPVTETEFDARAFALSWSAHGLRYGIPAEAVRNEAVLVANVSRGVIAEAARRFPVRVIEVTARPEILAARLAARGREGAEDVAFIGGFAAGARGDYHGPINCSTAATAGVTILAGPLNYMGVDPHLDCSTPQPSH